MTKFIMTGLVRVDQNGGDRPTAVLRGICDGVEYPEWYYSKHHNPAIYAEVEALIDDAVAADTVYEAPPPVLPDTPENRRLERVVEFSGTLDRMNPAWYNSLTDTQRNSLETWRQAWLDYPDTGILPTRVDIFN